MAKIKIAGEKEITGTIQDYNIVGVENLKLIRVIGTQEYINEEHSHVDGETIDVSIITVPYRVESYSE